jgi:hypothetical protein
MADSSKNTVSSKGVVREDKARKTGRVRTGNTVIGDHTNRTQHGRLNK